MQREELRGLGDRDQVLCLVRDALFFQDDARLAEERGLVRAIELHTASSCGRVCPPQRRRRKGVENDTRLRPTCARTGQPPGNRPRQRGNVLYPLAQTSCSRPGRLFSLGVKGVPAGLPGRGGPFPGRSSPPPGFRLDLQTELSSSRERTWAPP